MSERKNLIFILASGPKARKGKECWQDMVACLLSGLFDSLLVLLVCWFAGLLICWFAYLSDLHVCYLLFAICCSLIADFLVCLFACLLVCLFACLVVEGTKERRGNGWMNPSPKRERERGEEIGLGKQSTDYRTEYQNGVIATSRFLSSPLPLSPSQSLGRHTGEVG